MFRCRDEPVNTQSRCVNGSSIRQWIDKSGWQRKMHTETSPLGRVIRSGLIPLNFQRDKSVHSAPFAYIGRERLGCKNGSRPFFVRHIRVPPPTHIYVPKQKNKQVRRKRTCFWLFSFVVFYVIPFPLPGDEVHKEIPYASSISSNLLLHPFLLFLCLLLQIRNLGSCIGKFYFCFIRPCLGIVKLLV